MRLTDFQKNYPALSNFLVCYFPDADFENLTDSQVVKGYSEVEYAGEMQRVIDQGIQVIKLTDFPDGIISDLANRYFQNQDEGREWLDNIITHLKDCLNL